MERLSKDEQKRDEWEKKANELNKSMVFVFGCKKNEMRKDLKRMSAYNNEQYPQTIETACHIYKTQYKKRSGKNNKKGNDNSQKNSDEDNNDKKEGLISAHLTMEDKDNDDGEESDDEGDESNDNSSKDGFVGVHLINNATNMLAVNGS